MMTSTAFIWIILGCTLVTWVPRILPFIIVKAKPLPPAMMKWLSYIPICILTALVVEHVWIIEQGHSFKLALNYPFLLALIPTIIVAVWSRSLAITVVVGVILMALVRTFM